MGSLMAGWDSHVPHPNLVTYNRNKSLTRGEIEAFWKSRKQKEEEHFNDIYLLSPRTTKKNMLEEGDEVGETTGVEKLLQKNGWWIESKSAFLNEAPVIESEGSRQRYASYASQLHVAGSSSTGRTDPVEIGA